MSPSSPSSSSGRLAPAPFALAVIAVYLLSFGSQVLLSPPVTGGLSVLPFVLAQALLIGAWAVLHMRRLRDAGRPTGLAVGIAVMYALEVVLLAILVWLILESTASTTDSAGRESTLLHLFVLLYFSSLLSGDPTMGALQIWVIGFVVVMALPVVIALGFSLWAATRPRLAG